MAFYVSILLCVLGTLMGAKQVSSGPCEDIKACVSQVVNLDTVVTGMPMAGDEPSICGNMEADSIQYCLENVQVPACHEEYTRYTGHLVPPLLTAFCEASSPLSTGDDRLGMSKCAYPGSDRKAFQKEVLIKCMSKFQNVQSEIADSADSHRACILVNDVASCIRLAARRTCGIPYDRLYYRMWRSTGIPRTNCREGLEVTAAFMDRIASGFS